MELVLLAHDEGCVLSSEACEMCGVDSSARFD
jgi:hypothetical protein